jgi:hypothetical protein
MRPAAIFVSISNRQPRNVMLCGRPPYLLAFQTGSPATLCYAAGRHICKLHTNLGGYVLHLLLYLDVRRTKQPTVTVVALCQVTFGRPWCTV